MVVSYAAAVPISIGVLVNRIVDECGLSVLESGSLCHVEPHSSNLESTLMTQKAEEYGSHDNIFEVSAPITDINHCECPSQQPINVGVCLQLIGRGEGSNHLNTVLSSSPNGKLSSLQYSIQSMK